MVITLKDWAEIPSSRIEFSGIRQTRPATYSLVMKDSGFDDGDSFSIILEMRENLEGDALEVEFETYLEASIGAGIVSVKWLYDHPKYGIDAPSGSQSISEAFEWFVLTNIAKQSVLMVNNDKLTGNLEFILKVAGKERTMGTILLSATNGLFEPDGTENDEDDEDFDTED